MPLAVLPVAFSLLAIQASSAHAFIQPSPPAADPAAPAATAQPQPEPEPEPATAEASTSFQSDSNTGANASGREPAMAGAAGGSQIAGRVRIHFDTNFFQWTHVMPWDMDPDPPDTDVISFLGGPPIYGILGGGGFAGPGTGGNFGLGFGYGVHEMVVVGGRLGFGVTHLETEDSPDSSTLVAGSFTPYVEGVFLPGSAVRPFVLLRFGLGGAALTNRNSSLDAKNRTNTIGIMLGVGGGLHWFFGERASLDVALLLEYMPVWDKLHNEAMGMVVERDWEKLLQNIGLSIPFGISFWL